MGEVFTLPHAYAPRFPTGLDVVTHAGFSLLALTPDPLAEPSTTWCSLRTRRWRWCWALRARPHGRDLARIGRQVRIQTHAGVDSLNVAAAAIACYVRGQGRP